MRLSVTLLILTILGTCARAQIVGFKDSVEIHRTDTIYFGFGSSILSSDATAKVQQLTSDRPGELELYLEGHTDAVGSTSANDRLARKRSLNTRAVAVNAGWPEASIEIRHFGERKLSVKTSAREVRNRRVLLRSGKPRRYARLQGKITSKAGEPIHGLVIASSRYLKDTVKTDTDGSYDVWLPLEEAVQLDLYAKRYFFRSRKFTLTDTTNLTDFVTKLSPAVSGARMSVPDLFFVGNKTILLEDSEPTLPRLLQFMEMNPDLRVELAGHVNQPGPKAGPGTWSYDLSVARAQKIYNYLVEAGIDENRLRFKGYSNYEMVFPQARLEKHMRMNRRVEIRVL